MEIVYLQTEKISVEDEHPIKYMEDTIYENLKNSIKESGILVPLIVYEQENRYHILDGRHRLKAARELKIPVIPCKVIHDTNPRVLLANMYDPELYRKTYDTDELQKFQKQKEEEIQKKEKHMISELLNDLPASVKQKLGINMNINSLEKLHKVVLAIEGDIASELEKIKQERDKLRIEKEELDMQIEELKEKTKDMEININKQIEKHKEKIQQEIEKRVKEKLEAEKKKLSEIDQNNLEKIKKLRAEIQKEIEEEIKNHYQQEMIALQNEQKEMQKKLQEMSVQLNNAKKELKEKEEKIKAVEQTKAEKERVNQNLQAALEKLSETSSMIKKAEIALNEIAYTENRISIALKELNDLHIYLSSIDASNTRIEKPDFTSLKNTLEKVRKKATLLLEDLLPQLTG